MGFSINDKISIGKYSFDLQTEAKGNKIIGEILSQGKVLKRIEETKYESGREREATFKIHQKLKKLLISKFQEKASVKSEISFDENALRKQLLQFLELEEENLKVFFFKKEDVEIFSVFDKNYNWLKINEWIESIERKVFSKSFYGFPYLTFLPLEWQGKKLLIILLKEIDKDFKITLVVSGIRFSILRKKLHTNKNLMHQVIKEIIAKRT